MTEPVAERGGLKDFLRKSLIGGIVVLLPLTLVIAFFRWLFKFITGLIQPFTDSLIEVYAMPDWAGHLIVVALIVMLCFTVGNLVSTRVGNWLYQQTEDFLSEKVPGYKAVKDLVAQLMGHGSGGLRGEVCLVWTQGRGVDIAMTGLVTSRHPDGRLTVFVPCGPNPTTGFIYHVTPDLVELRPELRVDAVMKSAIACGVGAGEMLRRRG